MGPYIIRQVTELNHVVAQDHHDVKRITRPMLGFKSVDAAQHTLAGIELMHRLKKQQLVVEAGEGLTAAEQFHPLAASSPFLTGFIRLKSSPHQNLRQSRLLCAQKIKNAADLNG
jgi:hypothetical protein